MCSEDNQISIEFFCNANDLMAGVAFGEGCLNFYAKGLCKFFKGIFSTLPGFRNAVSEPFKSCRKVILSRNIPRTYIKYVQSFEFCFKGMRQQQSMVTGLSRSIRKVSG